LPRGAKLAIDSASTPARHIATLRAQTRNLWSGRTAPQLNRHCAICQYRTLCKNSAVATDDLSLISSISPKRAAQILRISIQTITQLSYTYRPKRKRRQHCNTKTSNPFLTNKNDVRYELLAIQKNQITLHLRSQYNRR